MNRASPTRHLTGGALIAGALADAGYKGIAAYVGTSELALCDAILGAARLELVNARGDSEAVFLATGANYAAPACYAALLHGARGLTNALGAIAEGRRSERSALCIVGMASRDSAPYLPPHHELDLIADAGRYAKAWFDTTSLPVGDGEALNEMVRAALEASCTTPYGPVILGVPQDVATSAYRVPSLPTPPVKFVTEALDRERIADAAARIRKARNPVIFVDDAGLGTAAIEKPLTGLAESLGAPVFQVAYQRGPMLFRQLRPKDVQAFCGPYLPQEPRHREVVAAADLILSVEDRNMYRRVVGPLPEVPRVALTSKPAATLKNDYDLARDVILEGDSTALLAALWAALLETRSSPRQCAWPAPMTYENHPAARRLASAIGVGFAAGLGPRVLVDDSQMLGGLMAQNYNSLPDCHVIGSHGGFVGSGLATAAGVALGAPETQVLCLLGDQGFTNSVQALTVIAERNLNVSIIVCNNGKSVSLAKQRAAETGEPNGDIAFLQNPCRLDYTAAAKAFGIPAWRFTWSAEADASAADALSQVIAERVVERGPAFIELVTPSDQTFWAGIWTTTGFE